MGKITRGISLIVIVFLIVMGFYAYGTIKENGKTIRDKACQEIGYLVSEYNDGWMCQDKDGYYHKVELDCNWWVTSCNIKEINFKLLGG